ncbi:MAG: TVP38/TMEM64 family protein [Thermoanaerobaculales bacterium]
MSTGKHSWWKLAFGLAGIAGGILLALKLGAFDLLTIDNIGRLDLWFDSVGAWAPVVFILLWIAACIFFLPGLAITIAGGLIFGAVWGTVWTTVGANLGATAAFLIGRYAARGMVEGMVEKNSALRKIDEGVKSQGWRMLMITRLVPIFPFSIQNYVYGLTDIPLRTYVLVTLPSMLPATVAYNFAAGSVRTGDFGKTLWYLGIAAVFFVLLSLIPSWVRKRYVPEEETVSTSSTS